ncbi:hypothetical protein GOV03_02660 [Candidatus Woesearchaeota archaeon]|nr:hypothetical protein [Candidatus Woesearchaeota archaeon]
MISGKNGRNKNLAFLIWIVTGVIFMGILGLATTTLTDSSITTSGDATAAGNITADYFLGNGSQLTGIDIYLSKYNNGVFNGSLYTKGSNGSSSDSNSLFQVIGDDGSPRFQIQNGGNEQASFIARSFIVVNQNDTLLNSSQNNICSDWGFNNIDCNTSSTGADFGVQDDMEVQGLLYADQGIYGAASNWGVHLLLGDMDLTNGGNNGTFTTSTNIFCDYISSPFTQNVIDNELWIKITEGDYEGAVAEMQVFLNSSCVELSNNPAWNSDISNQIFKLMSRPVFISSDGGFAEFYVGNDEQSKFEINIKNGT